MDPIMIGIAAVVILVILAGVFFMKKGKNGTTIDTPSNVKRPKTLAEQQRELELQRQSQQPSPHATNSLPQSMTPTVQPVNNTQSSHDELHAAEQLIQTQDYTGAITVLRRAIKNYPANSELHFALLNTYALAKDYEHFNAFYPEVLALNNLQLTAQANNLKILVDEEQSAYLNISTAEPVNTTTTQDDKIDFDFSDLKLSSDQPTSSDALSFESTTTPAVNLAPVANVIDTQSTTDLDFDFTLDELESKKIDNVSTTIEPVVSASKADELTFDDLDFDLSTKAVATEQLGKPAPVVESHTEIFAPTKAAPVQTEPSLIVASINETKAVEATDSEFDFDFNLPETSSAPATAAQPIVDTATTAPTAEKPADDFDFDFDLDVEPVTTPAVAPVQSTTARSSSEFEINFDEPTVTETKSELPEVPSTPVVPTTTIASEPLLSDDADLASFNLDEELILQAEAATTTKPTSTETAAPISEVVTQAPVSPVPAQSGNLISDDMFDFSLDDEPTTAPVATESTKSQPTFSDDDINLSFDESTVAATAPVQAPIVENGSETSAPVVEDLSAVFDVIKDIDTDTLNVDLAEQYLNLGEYDSAKRLLDEIKDTDNEALLERAEALRNRIA